LANFKQIVYKDSLDTFW